MRAAQIQLRPANVDGDAYVAVGVQKGLARSVKGGGGDFRAEGFRFKGFGCRRAFQDMNPGPPP